LANCLAILGVTDHRWLDYPDGGCAAIDPDAAAARLAEIIEEVRPDTVLTFGPDGQTGHTDHIAVCDWTTRAVERATHRAVLHYSTHTPEWAAAFMVAAVEHNVMMADEVELPNVPPDELSIVFPMTDEILELKERAMVAQASQSADLRDAMGADAYREVLREEVFRRAPDRHTQA
jgi:LmbE family N-acetylglucosaminyl deacetylase